MISCRKAVYDGTYVAVWHLLEGFRQLVPCSFWQSEGQDGADEGDHAEDEEGHVGGCDGGQEEGQLGSHDAPQSGKQGAQPWQWVDGGVRLIYL